MQTCSIVSTSNPIFLSNRKSIHAPKNPRRRSHSKIDVLSPEIRFGCHTKSISCFPGWHRRRRGSNNCLRTCAFSDKSACNSLKLKKDSSTTKEVFLKDTNERACAYIAGPAPNRWGYTVEGDDLVKAINETSAYDADEPLKSEELAAEKNINDFQGTRKHPLFFAVAMSLLAEIINSRSSFKIVYGRRLANSLGFCYTTYGKQRNYRKFLVYASGSRESPYEVLGVSPSATSNEIKRAYRRLALKYHPDVNKEANSQEKFMRIKHAYNTLLNSKSRKRYDSGYSKDEERKSKTSVDQEDFYGFGDFFRDIQEEFRSWEANYSSQGKPKSLWEELAEIGEEFVEFLEKELNITDEDKKSEKEGTTKEKGSIDDAIKDGIKENIDDIEAALSQLKKELGL